MSPYLAIQERERKAKRLKTIGVWLTIIGFGTFVCMAWSGSDVTEVTVIAMLGLLAGIIGVNAALQSRDIKRESKRIFDALTSADHRYNSMKEDSDSTAYKNTINNLFKKTQSNQNDKERS